MIEALEDIVSSMRWQREFSGARGIVNFAVPLHSHPLFRKLRAGEEGKQLFTSGI